MGKIKTILYPTKLDSNVSFDIKRKYLKENGFEVLSFRDGIKQISKVKIINFNFFETLHSKKWIACFSKFLVKKFIIFYLDLRGVRIVYTIHNKQGHELRYAWMETSLMKSLLRHSDKIVVLCNETKDYLNSKFGPPFYNQISGKIARIPLVSYEGAYPDNRHDYRDEWLKNKQKDRMIMLFLGGIRPYKNIELIIEAANSLKDKNIQFVIAGGGNKDYLDELSEMVNQYNLDNVTFIPHFVENSEMAAYAKASDILILPYDIKSSLNSGTCLFAFSYHRNVICPDIGTIKDLPSGLAYSYHYEDSKEHEKKLIETIEAAHRDYMTDHETFVNRQESLYGLTQGEYSVKNISAAYKKIYLELSKS